MSKKFYFMAGLPRSGSTVLSTILNQNPDIYSGPSSPVLSTMFALEDHLSNDELFIGYPKPVQAENIISSIAEQFYNDRSENIIIDKNRAWPARIPYIQGYIKQDAKVICPIRKIDQILTSFIMLIRKNPYKEGQPRINFIDEQLVKSNIPLTDDNRCQFLVGQNGLVGNSIHAIVRAFEEGYGDKIHFVDYNDLMGDPNEIMRSIYDFIGEPYYSHTFDNLKNENKEEDMITYGLKSMHEVRSVLMSKSVNPMNILSDNILELAYDVDMWMDHINKINTEGENE